MMARTLSTIFQSLVNKLPTGFALALRGGVLDMVLEATAGQIEAAEISAEKLMIETDPRSAQALLPDFERVLGPDRCGRDLDPLTVEQRQRLAHQRWTARGGQSIPYMISIAEKLGVTVTVEEFWPSVAGGLQAGQQLLPEGIQFIWRVNIPGLLAVTTFRAGASVAGDPLGWFEISNIECELRRVKPAHTELIFSYGA